MDNEITEKDLSDLEKNNFKWICFICNGKKTGKVKRKGISHKEDG